MTSMRGQKKLSLNKDSSSKEVTDVSTLKKFYMESLKKWCNEPPKRSERTSRKNEIAKILKKDPQTIKNMYLYGQGSLDQWLKVMDYISPLKQETIVQMYLTYPYIENKINSFSKVELNLFKNLKKLTPREMELITRLIETGIKINSAMPQDQE